MSDEFKRNPFDKVLELLLDEEADFSRQHINDLFAVLMKCALFTRYVLAAEKSRQGVSMRAKATGVLFKAEYDIINHVMKKDEPTAEDFEKAMRAADVIIKFATVGGLALSSAERKHQLKKILEHATDAYQLILERVPTARHKYYRKMLTPDQTRSLWTTRALKGGVAGLSLYALYKIWFGGDKK